MFYWRASVWVMSYNFHVNMAALNDYKDKNYGIIFLKKKKNLFFKNLYK